MVRTGAACKGLPRTAASRGSRVPCRRVTAAPPPVVIDRRPAGPPTWRPPHSHGAGTRAGRRGASASTARSPASTPAPGTAIESTRNAPLKVCLPSIIVGIIRSSGMQRTDAACCRPCFVVCLSVCLSICRTHGERCKHAEPIETLWAQGTTMMWYILAPSGE